MNQRTTIKRHADRAVPNEAQEILARGLVAHVGFVQGEQPFVIPLSYHYDPARPDRLYLHGSPAGRMQQHLASGAPVCITVTTVTGLVYSRTAKSHSINYESVVCFGRAHPIMDSAEKETVFEQLIARYHPGRTAGRDYAPGTAEQMAGVSVVEVEIEEMSAKARRGGPMDPLDLIPDAPGTCGVREV